MVTSCRGYVYVEFVGYDIGSLDYRMSYIQLDGQYAGYHEYRRYIPGQVVYRFHTWRPDTGVVDSIQLSDTRGWSYTVWETW